ncbi:MAG: hypothetical protein P8R54_27120 [Myxococcota bacterium]|nr:hypothetical protein [Myxococcota bacterium]
MATDKADIDAPGPPQPVISPSRCQRARQRLARDLDRLQHNPSAVIGLPPDAPPLLLRRVIRTRLDLYARLTADGRWPSDVRELAAAVRHHYQALFLAGSIED